MMSLDVLEERSEHEEEADNVVGFGVNVIKGYVHNYFSNKSG